MNGISLNRTVNLMPIDFSADRYNWPCNAKEDQKEIKEDLEAFQ